MENTTKKTIKRRDAIKVLAATGAGLVTATLLPGKWQKPVMQVGVLPAHAQSSACNAVVELTDEGFCESFPELACGSFNYVGQFSYTPTYLTPTDVDVVVCGEGVASGMVAGAPGTVYVLINNEDLMCEGARVVTVTFNGGCVGVWNSGEIQPNQSGKFFR